MSTAGWAGDFDVLDQGYVDDPAPIWDLVRASCPIAHSSRRGSMWLPTRYDDIAALAQDPERFSSRRVTVIPLPADPADPAQRTVLPLGLPPITADPPVHAWTRRLMTPWLSRRQAAAYEPMVADLCRSLASTLARAGSGDAAIDYARHVPVAVIARLLGVPATAADSFATWVHDVLGSGDDIDRRRRGMEGLLRYLWDDIGRRRAEDPTAGRVPAGGAAPPDGSWGPPAPDLLGWLVAAEHNGEPLGAGTVLGMAALVVLAGVDTTWSALAAALWHLALHPDQAELLRRQRSLVPAAVEELLRVYAPVTMAREVVADTTFGGCPMAAGDRVLLTFAAANHDPAAFPHPHRVILSRYSQNRSAGHRHDARAHLAFGTGIHRCAGSALARMQLRVAIDTWLQVVGPYHLTDPGAVTWVGGQVRGPTTVGVGLGSARPSASATAGVGAGTGEEDR